ncbi:MAG: efflux RND transporter periplasmic adaptor subunit [Alphaproteobacteria bacterium]|nr:efflux RND transporter periplasmic adaptor subunit [Alphaproteobacteria bacterium]
MKKAFVILIVLALAGAGLYYKHFGKKSDIVYDTTTVSRGPIRVDVTASGTIQPVNIVSVGTQVSGIIEKVFVDYNSIVKKGDLIAQLETFTLAEDLKEAQAAVTDAKAKLDYAKLNAKRNKELYEQNFIARYEWEEADLDVVNAQATYDKAIAQAKKAKRNLGYANIISPVNGIIVTKEVEEGQTVASSFQTPELFTIAEDLTKMQIEAEISEADIGQIKPGLLVNFTVDTFPADIFKGTVSQVRLQPTEDSNVVMYTVVISISNDDLRLLPGMTAYVTITVEEKPSVLRLQNMAFQFRPASQGIKSTRKISNADRQRLIQERKTLKPNQEIVYVLQDNKPVARKVTKGISNLLVTEILDGLTEGEKVILEDLSTTASAKRGGPP